MIRCSTADAVQDVIDLLASHGVAWLVVGAGSRLVPPEDGLRVPVLHLTGELAGWEVDLDGLDAGAGANLTQVCGSVARAGLSGMERLSGLPGSVGGAVRRAFEGRGELISELIEWAELVLPGRRWADSLGGRTAELSPADLDRGVVTRARFRLRADEPAAIRARLASPGELRTGRRGGYAPQIFEDHETATAEELLSRAGCHGMRVAGARVADDRLNAMVTGHATSSDDVLELFRALRRRVEDSSGLGLAGRLCFVDHMGRRIRP
jgi:UDP-N-acetylmuramate dehydrogenase